MLTSRDLYDKAETILEPAQGLVTALLIVVIAASVYMLFSKSATLRTTWVVYMFSP
jgi:hypothetical protein